MEKSVSVWRETNQLLNQTHLWLILTATLIIWWTLAPMTLDGLTIGCNHTSSWYARTIIAFASRKWAPITCANRLMMTFDAEHCFDLWIDLWKSWIYKRHQSDEWIKIHRMCCKLIFLQNLFYKKYITEIYN